MGHLAHRLQSGDWFEMKYGFGVLDFYVLWATPSEVRFCRPTWLISHADTWPVERLYSYRPVYLGRGKRKWWARFFTIDCHCPFTRPKGNKRESVFEPAALMVIEDEWPEYIEGGWR